MLEMMKMMSLSFLNSTSRLFSLVFALALFDLGVGRIEQKVESKCASVNLKIDPRILSISPYL